MAKCLPILVSADGAVAMGGYPWAPTLYTVSIMEFRDGKVSHETQYFADPFDAPVWRAQWVERGA